MKNKIFLFLSILELFWTIPVIGQQAEEFSIVVGSRVRVSTGGYTIGKKEFKAGSKAVQLVGTVERLQSDTLVLKTDISPEPVVVPIALIKRFDMSRGRKKSRPRPLEGAGIGLGSGILGGLIIDRIFYSDSDATLILMGVGAGVGTLNGFIIGATGKNATIGYLAGTVIGGLIGASAREGDLAMSDAILGGAAIWGEIGIITGTLVGLSKDSERWENVPLEHIRLGISPHGGHGITFSLSLTF